MCILQASVCSKFSIIVSASSTGSAYNQNINKRLAQLTYKFFITKFLFTRKSNFYEIFTLQNFGTIQ